MKITESASQQLIQALSQFEKEALSAGDRFTGRVLANTDGQLLMLLPDGSKINARVKSDTRYSSGDVLRLEVIGQKEGQLVVREVQRSEIQDKAETVDPASLLKALKLSVNDTGVEIVKTLLDMDIKPTAQLIEKAASLLESKQVPEPKQAVFLVLNEMENNRAYFPLLKEFSRQNFHFQDKWQILLNKAAHLEENTVVKIANQFLVDETLNKQEPEPLSGLITSIAEKAVDQNLISPKMTRENYIRENIRPFLQELISLPEPEAFENKKIIELIKQFFPEIEALQKSTQDEWIKSLTDFSKQLFHETNAEPLSIEHAKEIIEGSGRELPSDISVRSSQASLPKVDQWLAETERKLLVLDKILAESGNAESKNLLPEVRELRTAVQFFNDITSFEAFVQIPLALKENSTQGELYVMKRKGARRPLNAEDFSLFLSLKTKNLGMVDTFVHVQNKNVALRVMVEDEKFYELLMKEYKPLYEALKSKGYSLYELKYVERDEGLNLFNAVKKAREFTESNGQIDIKV